MIWEGGKDLTEVAVKPFHAVMEEGLEEARALAHTYIPHPSTRLGAATSQGQRDDWPDHNLNPHP